MHSGSQRTPFYGAMNKTLPYCSPSLPRAFLASGLCPTWCLPCLRQKLEMWPATEGSVKSTEKMSFGIPALPQFPPYLAHPRPNGSKFAFWLQESIKPAQQHSPFALQSELLQSKLLYNTEGSGRWLCQMQIHRYNSWSLCWHQDDLAVPVPTCLPQLRWFGFSVSWWRGIQCWLYASEEDNTQLGFQKCRWDPKSPLAFLWGCCFWHFTPWEQFIMNKHQDNWRDVLNIYASFPVYRLVGIGAKSSVAPSPLMLKGHYRVLWSTLTTQKSLGGERRNVQGSTHTLFHCPGPLLANISPPQSKAFPGCSQKGVNASQNLPDSCFALRLAHRRGSQKGCADFPSFPGDA